MQKLTIKQKAFADFYIETGNATESYIKAGYKVKKRNYAEVEGCKLLRTPKVKAYLDEKLAEIASSRIADATEVLEYLTSVMRGESTSEIVVVEGIGEGRSSAKRINKAPDEKEQLKAAELLGKRYGIFTEKLGVTLEQVVIIDDTD